MLYPIEIKSKRFITREIEEQHEGLKKQFEKYNMKFLVWNDMDILTKPLRHNFLRMRRVSVEHIEHEQIKQLLAALKNLGPKPLWVLYEMGFDIDLVMHCAWHQQLFFPLLMPISSTTIISLKDCEDLSAHLLSRRPDIHGWWNSLQLVA
ncbi:MAG: hypothetical protein IPG66_19065 [Hydrogenophilales bacterium]|nr:hypothetical protein [Hydrogenophilales bacterium]